LTKKIAIVGPESTGKSELAKGLAAHFETEFVAEIARSYLEKLTRPYNSQDVESIARLQLDAEEQIKSNANGFLFCDTNLLVIKIWMENAFGFCPEWILSSLKINTYDLILLTDIDLPWQPDPLREHPNEREYFFDLYKNELEQSGARFFVVSGFGEVRTQKAIEIIQSNPN